MCNFGAVCNHNSLITWKTLATQTLEVRTFTEHARLVRNTGTINSSTNYFTKGSWTHLIDVNLFTNSFCKVMLEFISIFIRLSFPFVGSAEADIVTYTLKRKTWIVSCSWVKDQINLKSTWVYPSCERDINNKTRIFRNPICREETYHRRNGHRRAMRMTHPENSNNVYEINSAKCVNFSQRWVAEAWWRKFFK